MKRNSELLLAVFVILALSILMFNENTKVNAATETTNATFEVGNSVPIIQAVRVTTNATRITSGTNGTARPTNVSQFVNFTVLYTDENAEGVSFLVCRTNAATASGCTNKQYYLNTTSFLTTNRSHLNKTTVNLASFFAYYNNTNTTIAYLFLSDGRGVSASRNVSFSVNHAPTATAAGVTGQSGPSNYTNETYTATPRGIYDVDNANNTVKFGSMRISYRWFRSADGGSSWSDTAITTQTFDCVAQTCNEADRFRAEVRVRDNHGYSNASGLKNSTDLVIANSPPLTVSAFQVRDGTGSLDTTIAYDTHAKNGTGTEIKWTDGSDADGDATFTYVCARTDPVKNLTTTRVACHTDLSVAQNKPSLINVTRVAAGTQYKTIGSLRYHATTNVNVTYIALITTDGSTSANGTILNVTLYLNNSKPVVASAGVNATRTHDQTPVLRWNVTDYDNGRNNGWPADTLQHYIKIINYTNANPTTYNRSRKANNNTYIPFPNLPWNTTVGDIASTSYWSNRTLYVQLWTNDSSATVYGNSSLVSDTFILHDYLGRLIFINMSNHQAASSYLNCAATESSLCSLTPLEHSNTTVAIKIGVEDRDGDCSNTNHDAWVTLCLNQTATATCTETTAGNYKFNLSRASSGGNSTRCFFQRTANSSTRNSPEFFRNNTAYKLFANFSNNQSVKRRNDANRNGSWRYNQLVSVNYTGAVSLGNGSVKLGMWSYGANRYTLRNWGNDNVTVQWNLSHPGRLGGGDTWTLNGTDVRIDDDNNVSSDSEGGLRYSNLTSGKLYFFDPPGWGLVRCKDYNCSHNLWNETLNTHYHIWAPASLSAGTYSGTIWIVATA